MGFSFAATSTNAPAPAGGGFSFGGTAATVGAPAAGANKAPAAGGGFAFAPAAPAPAAPAGGGGLFGKTASAAAPSTGGGFSFGGATPAPAAAPDGGASKSKPAAAAPAAGGFSFGGATKAATPAPAPSTGFSFGGGASTTSSVTPAPAASEKTETKAAPAPAAAGGGFNFGGAPAPSAATTKDSTKDAAKPAFATATPAAKSGFSFGGAATPGTTPAAKAPSPVKTPNTVGGGGSAATTPGFASPAATSNVPAGSAAASATATSTAQSTTTSKPQMIEPPPIEYQSLTIEQILNRFQSELETDAIAFMQEAQRVAHYDATLRDAQHSLSDLTNLVSRLMLHQSEVDAQLHGIGSYQRELGGTLDLLERNVDELFAAQSHVHVGDADVEREKGYERALDVDARLDRMNAALTDVVNDLNAAQERAWSSSGGAAGEGKDGEVGKIIGVFNAHHETLAYLEGKARAVESDMTMIGQMLAKSGQ